MDTKIILSLIAAVLISGCASTTTPGVTIISPLSGQFIAGMTVAVTVDAQNIILAAPNGSATDGEGHFHVWIDANEQRGAAKTFTFENVAEGGHTVRVELHKGEHSLYEGTAKTVTFTTGPALQPAPSTPPAPPSSQGISGVATVAAKEFDVTAKRFEFSPGTITVNKGDQVVLHITSTDVEHGFSLATYNIVETLPVNQTKTITFTATEAGEFNFFCSVFCGSGHGDMRGRLVVNP